MNAVADEKLMASELLRIGAIQFAKDRPFSWASGLLSPSYCDIRLTMAYPAVRSFITDWFEKIVHRHGFHPSVIVGTATGGIPHAAWLANRLTLPLAYVRSSPKAHGRGQQTEGIISRGQSAVVVEDLISTGGSSIRAVEAVRTAGADVMAVVAAFSYNLVAARDAFEAARCPVYALSNFAAVMDVASERHLIDGDQLDRLRAWHRDPESWSRSAM